jgi:hypothetical protein
MSIYDFRLSPDAQTSSRTQLEKFGPLIRVEISITDSLKRTYQLLNIPVPPPIRGLGVIDTGAYSSGVDKDILARFGVQPTGTREITSAGTKGDLDVFPVKINFPTTTMNRALEEAIAIYPMNTTYKNSPVIALIGREVLRDCVLIYNGKTGIYTLTH